MFTWFWDENSVEVIVFHVSNALLLTYCRQHLGRTAPKLYRLSTSFTACRDGVARLPCHTCHKWHCRVWGGFTAETANCTSQVQSFDTLKECNHLNASENEWEKQRWGGEKNKIRWTLAAHQSASKMVPSWARSTCRCCLVKLPLLGAGTKLRKAEQTVQYCSQRSDRPLVIACATAHTSEVRMWLGSM